MELTPVPAAVNRKGLAAFREDARGLGKSGESAASGREHPEFHHQACRRSGRSRAECVSQAGTRNHDPFRDGPRLMPGFVAQLLGQVMAGERYVLVRASYGRADQASAALLDARF